MIPVPLFRLLFLLFSNSEGKSYTGAGLGRGSQRPFTSLSAAHHKKAAVGVVLCETAPCMMAHAGFHRDCKEFLIFLQFGPKIVESTMGWLVTVGQRFLVSGQTGAPRPAAVAHSKRASPPSILRRCRAIPEL